MPSASKAQARLMEGIAHGDIPPKGGLTREKAEEWAEADEEQGTKDLPERKKKKKKLHKSFETLYKAVSKIPEDLIKGVWEHWDKLEPESGYYYHATTEERAEEIASRGHLKTHGPSYGTNQASWPDGGTEKRSYFSDKPSTARYFIPDGKPTLLRVHKSRAKIVPEKGTGDFITRDHIKAEHLEKLAPDGSWLPLKSLSKALSPGQPAPPRPSKKRAPRPETPFDPLEGVHHSSAPYQFRPHRLKDLIDLHKLDAYDAPAVKNVKIRHYVASAHHAFRKLGFASRPSFSLLKSMVKELKCSE